MTLLLALAAAAAGSVPPATPDILGGESICLATGHCPAPAPRRGPPGGLMFLALGLAGTGVTVIRCDRQRSRPAL